MFSVQYHEVCGDGFGRALTLENEVKIYMQEFSYSGEDYVFAFRW